MKSIEGILSTAECNHARLRFGLQIPSMRRVTFYFLHSYYEFGNAQAENISDETDEEQVRQEFEFRILIQNGPLGVGTINAEG